MATIRLIPSSYSLSSNNSLSISDVSNMYNNTDNTTNATITNSSKSTSNTYYLYINGFNFSDIPANATVNSFTVKIKCYESGLSTSYLMYLVNGTTATSDYASTMPSTSTQTITFDNVSSTWDTISGYGSNFGIRVALVKSSRNTTGYMYVYGAEILVDYTLSYTVTTTATNCTMLSDNPATVSSGESHTLWFNPTDSAYDLLTMTVGGNDVEPTLGKWVPSEITYKVSTNYSRYAGSIDNVIDGDTSTYFWSNGAQTSGQYP